MQEIELDAKATKYLQEKIGGGSGSAITNTIDFYQAVVGKKLNPTKFKALLANNGVDLSEKVGGYGVTIFFGADYYSNERTALGMTCNSDLDTLTFYICKKEINLTVPEGVTSDTTLGELLDAIADQVTANVGMTEGDITDAGVECLGNIAFLTNITLVNLTDVAACFE